MSAALSSSFAKREWLRDLRGHVLLNNIIERDALENALPSCVAPHQR